MKSKKISVKIISVLMAMVMLLLASATAVSAAFDQEPQEELKDMLNLNGKAEYDYVSLGASNTNGYGHLGYLPPAVSEDPLAASKADMNVYGYGMAPANAYPALIRDTLKNALGADVDVNLHQLAISSMRVEELRFLLDESYKGDAYLDWRFYDLPDYPRSGDWFEIAEPGGLDALREAYADCITNAELITFDMGWNNFGVYAFNNIKTILADGHYWMQPDLDQLDMDEQLRYKELKTIAFNYLKNNLEMTDEDLLAKLDMVADVMAYAAMGACSNFDVVMEKIYELNPDVQVVVLNIQNLADDLVVDFMGTELELGDLYGEMISLVDNYRRSVSPYADKYMFANAGDIDTFLDEITAWNGDPTTLGRDMKDCFDMYDDSLYVRSIVEYLMIGQAFSGLFDGFRTMASGYGLEVFKNDATYTYEFALTRTPEELLSLNLGALDLNNPEGADADVEAYGKALKDHLYNLRHYNDDVDPNTEGDQLGKDAYNYVFENLLAGLKQQKSEVEALLGNLKGQRDALLAQMDGVPEESYPPEVAEGLAQLNDGIAQAETGLATLTAAIDQIVPGAQAQFAAKLEGLYNTYHNTLNYAYDVVATFVQYAAKINTIEISVDSLNGFNAAADGMIGILLNDFINGSMSKFYYELEKNGIEATGAPEVPEYVLDESVFDDPALRAIAVLAVRYEFGNSFFAHPNVNGNEQIKDEVFYAILKGTTAKEDTEEDLEETWQWIQSYVKENHPDTYDVLMKLAKYLESEEFELLCGQLKKLYRKLDAATTPEQKQKLAEQTYKLLTRLQSIAAMATADKVEPIDYYVSIGDSTLSGYGLPRYIIGSFNGEEQVLGDEAPVLLAKKLFGDDWAEHFTKLDKGGIRTNDILVWLGDESYIDAYYERYTIQANAKHKDTEYYQNLYQSAIEKADLVTLTLGGGDVSTYIEKQLIALEATYSDPNAEGPYRMDWSTYFPEADMTEVYGHIETVTKLLDGVFGDEKIMGCDPEDAIPLVAEAFLYGLVGYVTNHSKIVDRIHQINPDAHIVIVGYFNTVDGMKVPVTIAGEEIEIPVGDLLGLLVETSNSSSLAYALDNEFSGNDYTTYVSVNDATTILDEDGIFDYKSQLHGLIEETWQTHAGIEGHKYIAEQIYTSVTTEYTRDELIAEILAAFGEYYEFIEDEFGEQIIDGLIQALNDAYKMAYRVALEEGKIDLINEYLDVAVKAISDTEAWLNEYREYARSEEFIAEVEKTIDDATATVEALRALINNADELDAESQNYAVALLVALETNVNDLADLLAIAVMDAGEYADPYIAALTAEVEKQIAIFKTAVKDAIVTMESIIADANEYIKDNLPKAYDQLVEFVLAQLPVVDQYLYDWFYNNPETVIGFFNEYGDEMIDFVVDNKDIIAGVLGFIVYNYGEDIACYVIENADVILPAFVSWFETYGERTWELIKVYLEALGVDIIPADELIELVGDLALVVKELGMEALEKVVDREFANLKEAVEYVANLTGEALDEVKALIENATNYYYIRNAESLYVAIGGEGYADLVADALGVGFEGIEGLRASDIIAILDSSYKNDAYGNALLANNADLAAKYLEAIKKADLITLDLGEADLTGFVADQMAGKLLDTYGDIIKDLVSSGIITAAPAAGAYEMDWTRFAEFITAEDVEEVKAAVEKVLVEAGLPETYTYNLEIKQEIGGNTFTATYPIDLYPVDFAMFAVECYLYAATNYAYNYAAAIEAIHAVNPDAQVLVIGALNPFQSLDLVIEGVNVGEILAPFANAMDAQALACALTLPNTTFVSVKGAEATVDTSALIDVKTMSVNADALGATEAGNAYIAEKILEALTLDCTHAFDNACDAICNICNAEREVADHVYDNKCDADCNVCGATREVGAHTFGEWTVVTEPTTEAEGLKERVCTECGYKETDTIAKLDKPADPVDPPVIEPDTDYGDTGTPDDTGVEEPKGLPAGAVVAIVIGAVLVVGLGGFAIFWFVIKKKKFSDLVAIFKK